MREKDIFEPWISKGQGKLLTNKLIKVNKQIKQLKYVFRPYLGWSLKHVAQNNLFISISFYRNVFLSFYPNIVCQNVLCE
jgi:hypothetical protein